jgi:two-component sensor histidine kinase
MFYGRLHAGQDFAVTSRWRQLFLQRVDLGLAASVTLCLVCVALAALARMLLGVLGPTLPFATFFPAVLICALFGGLFAGVLSVVLSILTVWLVFIEPAFTFAPLDRVHLANFILFALSGLLVAALALVHRQLLFAVEAKERERRLLVGEIEHRSKNILAVVASLIHQTVKDKDVADTLIKRMCAVADTNGLLDDTGTEAASLRALFVAGIEGPHGAERIELNGPEMQLGAKQARALRLVIHELATNALKYGALSQPGGRIKVDWRADDGGRIHIDWCELDGPKVAAPAKHNFGSRLILATLKQIDAEFTPAFPETGYCYQIVLPKKS